MSIDTIVYVTSSPFKKEEAKIIQAKAHLSDGTPVGGQFQFEFKEFPINEILEVDLRVMVQDEVTKAYNRVRVPCIVEHAGLIFVDYQAAGYPGGLTKPMWNTLGDKFCFETHASGREAIARAVVAYCDGMMVKTFVGETRGTLTDAPRGSRDFYWDTVFVPDTPVGHPAHGKTYAEIVADAALGLELKVLEFSQSRKAIIAFLDYRKSVGLPALWR